ncbi:hypothetical protein [Pseudooceanicola sp. LIPI14-2-Ac024]|uniref:hypothetical protein n=1 Tax=Pseudooceanicola sp. LIPI14-2-Ac024 TaxID=3344875 RepID=UPI0035D05428
MQFLLPALIMLLCLALAPAAVLSSTAPDTGPWLVVVPPWVDGEAVLARAGARPIGPLRAPLGLIADGPPGTGARLHAMGAWAVLDARRIAALCGRNGDFGA